MILCHALDLEFLNQDCSLQSRKLQIHRRRATALQIESRFRAKGIYSVMCVIFCERSLAFWDQVVVPRESDPLANSSATGLSARSFL